eukprot:426368_1
MATDTNELETEYETKVMDIAEMNQALQKENIYNKKQSDSDSELESDDENPVYNTHNIDEKTAINQEHRARASTSIEHFRIKSVTIFGGQLVNDIDTVRTEMGRERSVSNHAWIMKRKCIENELIETEKHYCADLNTLCNEILTEIFNKKLLDDKYKSQVTSNLPQIRQFHNEYFLQELVSNDIIQIFNTKSDFLKMYIEFVKQYQRILDIFAIHGNKSKNKKLYKFLKQKRKEKKPLTNLLIAPIQRIPRYLLLLKDIKKTTPNTYKDSKDINSAIIKVNDITNHINQRQKEIENMSQCLQIQHKLRNFKQNLVEPHRKYINQYTFHLKAGKKLKLTQFCVFSDTVILTDHKWKVIGNMKMRSINMNIINDKNGKGFILNHLKSQKYYDTKESMNDYVDELHNIIINSKQTLVRNDLSLLDANSNSNSFHTKRIEIELKNDNSNNKNKNKNNPMIQRSNTLPIQIGAAAVWQRSMKLNENNLMTVEWKFIDENNESQCVTLKHKQINGQPNKKTMRNLKINNVERYNSNKSNKSKFKCELNAYKKNNKNGKISVSLIVSIKYDPKKGKYLYEMNINGKSYSEALVEWENQNIP